MHEVTATGSHQLADLEFSVETIKYLVVSGCKSRKEIGVILIHSTVGI